ncbi:MAG: hypothetical protein U0R65_15300 [Candidatus Nanopelagicales bacterium]
MAAFLTVTTALVLADLVWLGRTLRHGGRPQPAPRSHPGDDFGPPSWR